GEVVDVISPDGEGDVDFKGNLRGGFKVLRLLKLALFYDRLVIQYHPTFFFESQHEGTVLGNVAVAASFSLLFLMFRGKVEIVCHEIEMPSTARTRLEKASRRMMWALAPRVVFHTRRELEAFATRFRGGRTEGGLELRAHERDFRKYQDVSQAEARLTLG